MLFSPIHHEVVLVPTLVEQILEQPSHPSIVRLLLELQRPHVVEVILELLGQVFAQYVDGDAHFQLFNEVLLSHCFFFFDAVPGQFPLDHEHQ